MKTSAHLRLKSLYFQEDAWLKRNWLIGRRGPQRQIIGSCRAPEMYGHVFWWGKWPPQWETCSVNVIERWRPLVLLWLIAAHSEIKKTNGSSRGCIWVSGIKDEEQENGKCGKWNWEIDVCPFGSSEVLVSSIISTTSVKLTPCWLDQCVRWMVGGDEEPPGWQGGGQRGQGRQGPPFSIYWSGRERAGSFEAVKWSEFQHDHGDCSRPGRHFDEVVLKMERMFCARRFKGRLLFCWSWNYTQAGERAAVANLNLQEGRFRFKRLECKII